MNPTERWQLGLAVMTAFIGPPDRRVADITSVVGEHDPRQVLFGVLAVARDLLALLQGELDLGGTEILQALAEQKAAESG
jgi:hypothetical protein